ncbi:MAG: DNA-binding response regulator [Spirochaetaceae bacterium]|nr:MAG: DNA-binding response regulator [Spirochaetaceae bacterium]
MDARILVVEDVAEMAELVQMYLAREGMTVDVAASGEAAIERARSQAYDLVVLDLNLPGMDGFEVLQALRHRSSVPVIVVSARDADEDIIHGLGAGADEFVTKPFSPRVLVARVRAVLRRDRLKGRDGRERYTFGPYEIDVDACTLSRNGERLALSSREFEVLAHLVRHAGLPHTPKDLYEAVWGREYGDLASVGVYVQRLRRKLGDDAAAPLWIQTVHGAGYRFNDAELSRVVQGGV